MHGMMLPEHSLCTQLSHASSRAGPIQSRHVYLDMRDLEVRESAHTRPGRTCPAAMGFSFAAGTTDGGHIFWLPLLVLPLVPLLPLAG